MHTAVLVLGMLLILSEIGAIGFMMINTVYLLEKPQTAVHLVPAKSVVSKRTMKVTVIEDKKATTAIIPDTEEKHPTQDEPNAGYFSLVSE